MTVFLVTSVNAGFRHRITHIVERLAAADAAYRHELGHSDVTVDEMAQDEARAMADVERVRTGGNSNVRDVY